MSKRLSLIATTLVLLAWSGGVVAQEIEIHHGFVFYAGKYSVDEETFGLYADGHQLEILLKEVPAALTAFESFETWHMMGNVFTGLSLAAFVFGGVAYMPGVREELPEITGIVSFGTGVGLLALGVVFEFISWSRINTAAELYNKEMDVDDGPSSGFEAIPQPNLALLEGGAHLSLGWRF